jgi:hypothetical protein
VETFTRTLLDRAKGLVGSTLLEVRYYNIPSSSSENTRWDLGVAHTTEYGVDLLTDRGVMGVVSSDEFTDGSMELQLVAESIIHRHQDVEISRADAALPWDALRGRTISKSKLHWVDSSYTVRPDGKRAYRSHHYDPVGAQPFSLPQSPLALELHFDAGGNVLLVSGGWEAVDAPIVESEIGISVLWNAGTFKTLVPNIARQLKKSW